MILIICVENNFINCFKYGFIFIWIKDKLNNLEIPETINDSPGPAQYHPFNDNSDLKTRLLIGKRRLSKLEIDRNSNYQKIREENMIARINPAPNQYELPSNQVK